MRGTTTRMEFTDYIALGFFALMVAGGLALIISGIGDLRRALASPSWPVVPGVIRESEVSAKTSTQGSSSRGSTTYYIRLSAGYRVNEQDYETGTIYFGASGGSGDASAIELEHLRYPVGAKVAVYHDPRDPAVAVLRPGFDLDVLGPPAAGLVIVLMGLAFTLLFLGAFKGLPVMPLGFRAFGLIFLVSGGSMLTAGLVRFRDAHESPTWPVSLGTIVYAQEHANTSEVEDSDGDRRTVTTFGAPLAYRYEVKGRTYFSNIRCFGALAGASEDWAQSILARYPTGRQVRVFYDPRDPNTAVLEPGITSEAYWLPGAGLAFMLFGVAAWLLGSRLR